MSRQSYQNNSQSNTKIGKWFARLIILAIAGATCLLTVGWFSQVYLAATNYADIPPQKRQEEAARLANLSPAERQILRSNAKQRLLTEPLDNENIQFLAILETIEKNNDVAEALSIENSKRSVRDTQAQLFAMFHFVKTNDYNSALRNFDALVRSKPNLSSSLFRVLNTFMTAPSGLEAIVRALNANPPWRQNFFYDLVKNDKDFARTSLLLSGLRKHGGKLKSDELSFIITDLMRTGAHERAYYIWLDNLNEQELRSVSNIFDGQFNLQPKNLVFDWNLSNPKNGSVSIVSTNGDVAARALQVDLYGSVEKFNNVSQILKLSPGKYSADFEVATRDLKTDGGLKWSLACYESRRTIGQSESIVSSASLSKMAFEIDVPPQDCTLQYLLLVSAGNATLDLKLSSRMIFDNITITKISD